MHALAASAGSLTGAIAGPPRTQASAALSHLYCCCWPPLGFAAAGQVSFTHPFIIAKNAYLFL
jgi:hypothetical protein